MSGLILSRRSIEDLGMSEATASQEPSMEEILASIRRIISEEGQEQPGGDAVAPLAAPLEAAAAPAPKPQTPPKPLPQPAAVMADDDDDDDELVLTEVVTASDPLQNNVVPLKPEARVEPEAMDDDIELALDEPALPDFPAEVESSAGVPVEPDQIEAPTDEPVAPAARSEPQPARAPRRDADEFTRMTEELPDLVAPEVATAATASFAQLLQSNRRTPEVTERPTGDGLLVETLVRMAVEPMLKAWLDTHLEPIVERIVRREVERLARKAELS